MAKPRKIINDPVYGFLQIPEGIIYEIIQHRAFQRLRRIRQLGFTNLVYPGAEHTRFQHALGAFHLMTAAIEVLREKGVKITKSEKEGAQLAILLHDVGHGPFSHTLEGILLPVHHEVLTLAILNALNKDFNGKLTKAIQIFKGVYPKKFLHELVSSQLDVDRLDYLNRDRFFTGVYEGVIGYDRIIQMLNVHEGKLVVEEKGIYSIEKFLVARRLMYWQVYLHKTALSAEGMLIQLMKRVKAKKYKTNIHSLDELMFGKGLKTKNVGLDDLKLFVDLDDNDIIQAIKNLRSHKDKIVRFLSSCILERKLFKTFIGDAKEVKEARKKAESKLLKNTDWSKQDLKDLIIQGKASNSAYKSNLNQITMLFKDGSVKDISEASKDLDIRTLSKTVTKHYIAHPSV